MNLWNHTDTFIRERTLVKGVTPATIDWYRYSFQAFRPALDAEFESVVRKTRLDIVTQIGVLQKQRRGIKAVSINTYLRCVKAFLNWAHQDEPIPDAFRLDWLKEDEGSIAPFSEDQVRRLLSWKPRSFADRRLAVLVALLLDTGLRIAEALSLTRERIDLEGLTITVRGKGRKERTLPISYDLRRVVTGGSSPTSSRYSFPPTTVDGQPNETFYANSSA